MLSLAKMSCAALVALLALGNAAAPQDLQIQGAPGGDFTVWLVCASAALFLINQGLTLYKAHIKEQPDPKTTYLTKSDFKEALAALAAQVEKLNEDFAMGRRNESLARREIYKELNALSNATAALKEAVETLKQREALEAIARKPH